MKPYEKYKETGIDWVEKIPSHWEIKTLKRFAKICNGQDHKDVWDVNGEYPIFGSGGVFGKANMFLHKGPSVLLGRKGTIDKPRYVDKPFWSVDTAYYTDIFPITHPKLFYYLTTTIEFNLYKYGSAVPSMTQQDLGSIRFPVSNDFPEQTQIANFLDQKTAQIDGLIEQKERLIKLLAEKRTALITQAVTKGLDPSVEMKDSGVDWLGEIPKHWEMKRLRFLVETNPLKSEVALNENELVSFVPMEAIHENGGLTLDLDKELNEVYSSYTYFKDKDVVVAKITPCFENGKGSIAKGLTNSIGFGTTELHVLRSTKKMNHEFLFYLTISDSFRKIGESWMYGAGGQKRIPEIFIKDLIIPICDIAEQKIIVDRLTKKVKKMHSLKLKIKDSIHKLKEYREALITAAVTGQIKV